MPTLLVRDCPHRLHPSALPKRSAFGNGGRLSESNCDSAAGAPCRRHAFSAGGAGSCFALRGGGGRTLRVLAAVQIASGSS